MTKIDWSALPGRTIHVMNVNYALPRVLQLLSEHGVRVSSRGMSTIELPGPTTTVYMNPMQRVLFNAKRDANPFFHLAESLWIIAGSEHAALPAMFLPSIRNYSDDGERFHGAYGFRLRYGFDFDQLKAAINLLLDKRDTRQCVLSIWDPRRDMNAQTKDVPCNDMVMFKIRDGKLNMTVCNRSNDAILGAFGANAVQFSMLQEYVACAVGVDVGYYFQQSDSLHVYEDSPHWQAYLADPHCFADEQDLYDTVHPLPLAPKTIEAADFIRRDAHRLAHEAIDADTPFSLLKAPYASRYFRMTVLPMVEAFGFHLDRNYRAAREAARAVEAQDWRYAALAWLDRREANHQGAK